VDRLLEHLADWKPFRALVVGDFMLDQLLKGHAERLSADAPVPVLDVRSSEETPGGAANLCLDLAAMRGSVVAFGVVGEDHEGGLLRVALGRAGIEAKGLIADATRPTTVKRNLIGLAQARHPQKMFRVDFESREPIASDVMGKLLAAFDAELASCDVVCLEDYGKGVCTPDLCREVIDRARAAGKAVLVDPASISDYTKYRGATMITPNRSEGELATGMRTCDGASPEHNGELAARLLDELDLDAVVLTLDRHGALLLERGGTPEPIPTVVREVYDVTGAGDMMLAGLAAGRANGMKWPDAVRFANAAAGLEVEVFGVMPMPLERIHHEILVRHGRLDGKLRTPEQLDLELRFRREQGQRIVFTNGCFDVLHAGHVSLLERARAQGDFLVVGLNSDASVRAIKGADRPINSERDRAIVLGALEAVGAVVVFDEDTPVELIGRVRPDVHVKGADYEGKDIPERPVVESYGGRVELLELVPGKSTTGTIEKMRGG